MLPNSATYALLLAATASAAPTSAFKEDGRLVANVHGLQGSVHTSDSNPCWISGCAPPNAADWCGKNGESPHPEGEFCSASKVQCEKNCAGDWAPASPKTTTYTAAVGQAANSYNFANILAMGKEAKAQGAEIIIFPENGLGAGGGNDCNIEVKRPFDKNKVQGDYEAAVKNGKSPCTHWEKNLVGSGPLTDNPDTVISTLANIAVELDMYLVVNVGDGQDCDPEHMELCPMAGTVAFNTEVVFDPKGELLAKYYKKFLFSDQKTAGPPASKIGDEVYGTKSTFTANFKDGDVTFGLAVCNDINSAATMLQYVDQGIDDLIVSDNWHNSYSFQTISAISNGFSYAYDFNMLVSSAGNGAGGSGIFSKGKTLAVDNLLIYDPNWDEQGDEYANGCIDAANGQYTSQDNCINSIKVAQVVSQPKPKASASKAPGAGTFDLSGDVATKDAAKAWPVAIKEAEGLGLPIPEIVSKADDIQPLAIFSAGPKAEQFVAASKAAGNIGKISKLSMPDQPGTYTFTTENNGVKCEITATIASTGSYKDAKTAKPEYFKVMTVNSDIYAPDVPCPFQWNFCSISRCIGETNLGLCEAGPLGPAQNSNTANISEVSIKMTTAQASVVSPLIVDQQLVVLDAANAKLDGPWTEVHNPPSSAEYTLTMNEGTWGEKGFGYATVAGNAKVDDDVQQAKCSECVNALNYWDVTKAAIQGDDLRSAFCNNMWFGSGGPPSGCDEPNCWKSMVPTMKRNAIKKMTSEAAKLRKARAARAI